MSKIDILNKYEKQPKLKQLIDSFSTRKKSNVKGLTGSSLSFVTTALFKKADLPFLLLFNDKEEGLLFKRFGTID